MISCGGWKHQKCSDSASYRHFDHVVVMKSAKDGVRCTSPCPLCPQKRYRLSFSAWAKSGHGSVRSECPLSVKSGHDGRKSALSGYCQMSFVFTRRQRNSRGENIVGVVSPLGSD